MKPVIRFSRGVCAAIILCALFGCVTPNAVKNTPPTLDETPAPSEQTSVPQELTADNDSMPTADDSLSAPALSIYSAPDEDTFVLADEPVHGAEQTGSEETGPVETPVEAPPLESTQIAQAQVQPPVSEPAPAPVQFAQQVPPVPAPVTPNPPPPLPVPPPAAMPSVPPAQAALPEEPQRENEAGEIAADAETEDDKPKFITIFEDMTPSRTMTINQNQLLQVKYPGAGWIYLGEVDAENLFTYQRREPAQYNPGTASTLFTLFAQKQGKTLLRFYREDALTNTGVDDYLEVTVLPVQTGQPAVVSAPSYHPENAAVMRNILPDAGGASVLSETAGSNNAAPAISAQQTQSAQQETNRASPLSTTVIQENFAPERNSDAAQTAGGTDVVPQAALAEDIARLYELALQAFNAAQYPQALDYINRFLADTNINIDKGLFLKGQILESASPSQNIKDSLAAFTRLIEEFPASSLWQQAKNKITYLNRFYFQIR